MIQIEQKSKCNGCHACYSVCPKQCISMQADSEGFLYPQVDASICVKCGKCKAICPVVNGKTERISTIQTTYASYNKAEDCRLQSSSGGIFTLLAECVLNQGGVVVGAALSKDCRTVYHSVIETTSDLEKIRGSKYVQSDIGDIYKKVKCILDSKRLVYFSGTPCQIGGLLAYLGKEYANLFTQDFICHGVPSPAVWKDYLEYREQKAKSLVTDVHFRNKKLGWRKFSLEIKYKNHLVYSKNLKDDWYLQGFLKNMTLRPSCYDCAFKQKNRQADITLADFWSIHKSHKELDDDKGMSFVWIHSEKGNQLFHQIDENIYTLEVPLEEVLTSNVSALASAVPSPHRTAFFEESKSQGTIFALKKYTKKTIKETIRNRISVVKHSFFK